MKKNTKKLFLGLGLSLLGTVANAQDGLEKIIVEKYYISTKEDSVASQGTLPVGSVTYRVYADMLPGYRLQALYGNAEHPLKINTTTTFFNNEDRGATTANAIASAQLKNNTVALDSWFSVGASATGQFGVLKSDDNGAANLLTLSSILNNTASAMGIGLKTQDGNMAGSPEAVTFVGLTSELDVFDATSQSGNSFITKNGAISALSGAVGPTAENRILLGQFTTDGVFTFELNIQIGTPTAGVSEKYVVSNPINGEKTIASLNYESNIAPIVTITSPANNATFISGEIANITASASDKDGSISQVEFFVDGKSIGVDNSAPYTYAYTSVTGTHLLTAIAKDNKGDSTVSETITIVAKDNQAPTVLVALPATAMTGDMVAITATANDVDGTIASVEFFVDSVSVGTDKSAPFSVNWNATKGTHKVYAIATDDKGLTGSSKDSVIIVKDNVAPIVTISNPANAITGDSIVISATASDTDGTIASVEFFVDSVSVGIDKSAPFSINWNATKGSHKIYAIATDNKGLTGTSSDSTIIVKEKDNQAPTVLVALPATAMTGDMVAITATANDVDGTIASVEFFVDSVSVGTDKSAPFSVNWNATKGTHKVYAIATDDKGSTGTSKDSVIIIVKDNVAPIVTVSNPANAITGDSIVISATASDTDGTIASVEFFVNDISVGTDATSPYSVSYKTTVGKLYIKAVATDNLGLKGTSKLDSILVVNNQVPIVTIQAPKNAITGDVITFTSNAEDKDGSVTQVEFFIDNVSVGIDPTAPYSIQWKSTVGEHKVKAIATDNRGFTGTSADSTMKVIDNLAPTLTLSVDSIATTNDDVTITATSTDADGTVKKIDFYIDNKLIASDSVAPFSTTWKAEKGTHIVKAIAMDNRGLTTTASNSILVKDKNVGLSSIEAIQTKIYPNPASTEMTIITSENASLEITDISGKVIAYKSELTSNTTYHVAVSDFTAGVYLVRIFNANYTKTERVVINN